jgi:hypothetical protein
MLSEEELAGTPSRAASSKSRRVRSGPSSCCCRSSASGCKPQPSKARICSAAAKPSIPSIPDPIHTERAPPTVRRPSTGPPQRSCVRKGKADSSGSWIRVEEFRNSSSALRLAVLFGLERAALALGHHANLHARNGLFPTLGLLDITGLGLALVLVGGFWTGCIADSRPPRQIVVGLEQYPCSTTSRISRPNEAQSTTDTPTRHPSRGSLRLRNLEPTFETQLDRLSSLGLRPIPRGLLYLPCVAGRRGLGRALDSTLS